MKGPNRTRHTLLLALACVALSGCGLVGTTYRATKFVVKTTVDVGKAGVKVVTWPIRAIRGDPKAKADAVAKGHSAPSGPEPVIAGHLSTEDRGKKPAGPAPATGPDDGPRVLAAEPDDDVRLR